MLFQGVDVHAVQRLAAKDPDTGNWRVYNSGGRDAGRVKIAACRTGTYPPFTCLYYL